MDEDDQETIKKLLAVLAPAALRSLEMQVAALDDLKVSESQRLRTSKTLLDSFFKTLTLAKSAGFEIPDTDDSEESKQIVPAVVFKLHRNEVPNDVTSNPNLTK